MITLGQRRSLRLHRRTLGGLAYAAMAVAAFGGNGFLTVEDTVAKDPDVGPPHPFRPLFGAGTYYTAARREVT